MLVECASDAKELSTSAEEELASPQNGIVIGSGIGSSCSFSDSSVSEAIVSKARVGAEMLPNHELLSSDFDIGHLTRTQVQIDEDPGLAQFLSMTADDYIEDQRKRRNAKRNTEFGESTEMTNKCDSIMIIPGMTITNDGGGYQRTSNETQHSCNGEPTTNSSMMTPRMTKTTMMDNDPTGANSDHFGEASGNTAPIQEISAVKQAKIDDSYSKLVKSSLPLAMLFLLDVFPSRLGLILCGHLSLGNIFEFDALFVAYCMVSVVSVAALSLTCALDACEFAPPSQAPKMTREEVAIGLISNGFRRVYHNNNHNNHHHSNQQQSSSLLFAHKEWYSVRRFETFVQLAFAMMFSLWLLFAVLTLTTDLNKVILDRVFHTPQLLTEHSVVYITWLVPYTLVYCVFVFCRKFMFDFIGLTRVLSLMLFFRVFAQCLLAVVLYRWKHGDVTVFPLTDGITMLCLLLVCWSMTLSEFRHRRRQKNSVNRPSLLLRTSHSHSSHSYSREWCVSSMNDLSVMMKTWFSSICGRKGSKEEKQSMIAKDTRVVNYHSVSDHRNNHLDVEMVGDDGNGNVNNKENEKVASMMDADVNNNHPRCNTNPYSLSYQALLLDYFQTGLVPGSVSCIECWAMEMYTLMVAAYIRYSYYESGAASSDSSLSVLCTHAVWIIMLYLFEVPVLSLSVVQSSLLSLLIYQQRFDQAKRLIHRCLMISCLYCSIICALIFGLLAISMKNDNRRDDNIPLLLSLFFSFGEFNDSSTVLFDKFESKSLAIFLPFWMICLFGHSISILYLGYFISVGKLNKGGQLLIGSFFCAGLPTALFAAFVFDYGLSGIWFGMSVGFSMWAFLSCCRMSGPSLSSLFGCITEDDENNNNHNSLISDRWTRDMIHKKRMLDSIMQ